MEAAGVVSVVIAVFAKGVSKRDNEACICVSKSAVERSAVGQVGPRGSSHLDKELSNDKDDDDKDNIDKGDDRDGNSSE